MLERHWILRLGTFVPHGYNATYGGEGQPSTPLVREQIANALRGRKDSPEVRANKSRAAKARMTADARAHLSAVNTGRPRSEAARARMCSRAQSPETRAKLAANFTPERRALYAQRTRELRAREKAAREACRG